MDAEPAPVLHSETAVPVTWVGYALGGAAASWPLLVNIASTVSLRP
jgi:hypothetical protein